jgi:predicted site-specific integrase-resolvase
VKKVTKIAPTAVDTVVLTEQPKLRVAAYCRVSTDSDEQKESLETQIEHYESYIKANPTWAFAGFIMTRASRARKGEASGTAPDDCRL